MLVEPEYKQVKVKYEFHLPDNRNEFAIFLKATDFYIALHDIHDRCKQIYKYKENPTEEEIDLAERIDEVVAESGALDL